MLRRFKNLWAWSKQDPEWYWMKGVVDNGTTVVTIPEENIRQGFNIDEMIENQFSNHRDAQIIYPDPKKEILRANPEPSIDELLNI